MKIPKGKVKTYKEVAIAIKMPKAVRAVANACGKNPCFLALFTVQRTVV